jgi:hypothetical protein
VKTLRIAGLLAACSLSVLAGCATTRGDAPRDSNEVLAQIAVSTAVTIAVDRLVTRDHATPAEAEARAGRVLLVASSLKSLGSDALATLPQIRAALDPLLDKANLSPAERMQADLLVSALVAVGLERTDAAKYVAQVSFILDEVIRVSSAYLPAAESARIGHDHFGALFAGDRRRLLPACS